MTSIHPQLVIPLEKAFGEQQKLCREILAIFDSSSATLAWTFPHPAIRLTKSTKIALMPCHSGLREMKKPLDFITASCDPRDDPTCPLMGHFIKAHDKRKLRHGMKQKQPKCPSGTPHNRRSSLRNLNNFCVAIHENFHDSSQRPNNYHDLNHRIAMKQP